MEKKSKCAIVFDTNIFWSKEGQEDPFNCVALKSIVGFIKKNKISERVSLFLPEIVLEELVSQASLPYIDQISEIEDGLESISKKFGIEFTKLENYNSYDFKGYFRSRYLNSIQKGPLEIIPLPELNLQEITKRALNKTPPFNNKDVNSDKGFKDTLIWLTILNKFKDEEDLSLFFITKDGIFKSPFFKSEFKDHSSKGSKFFSFEGSEEVLTQITSLLEVDKLRGERINKVKESIMKEEVLSPILSSLFEKDLVYGTPFLGKKVSKISFIRADFPDIEESGETYLVSGSIFVNVNLESENQFLYSVPIPRDVEVGVEFSFDSKTSSIIRFKLIIRPPLSKQINFNYSSPLSLHLNSPRVILKSQAYDPLKKYKGAVSSLRERLDAPSRYLFPPKKGDIPNIKKKPSQSSP